MEKSLVTRVLRFACTMALAGSIPATIANAQVDKRVAVVDEASSPIVSFYATPSGFAYWGDDLLGDSVIGINQFEIVNVEDGSDTCLYDFKAVLANGRIAYGYRLNACRVETWTVTD